MDEFTHKRFGCTSKMAEGTYDALCSIIDSDLSPGSEINGAFE